MADASYIEGEYRVMADPQREERRRQEEMRERAQAFVSKLQRSAEERVSKRQILERGWIEDLMQYHGKYTDKELRDIQRAGGSELHLNITRPKTNAASARLTDMMFPTDDKNWDIQPTPVPELVKDIDESDQQIKRLAEQLDEMETVQGIDRTAIDKVEADLNELVKLNGQLRDKQDMARAASKAMEEEIHDDLVECSYNIKARDVIEDACQIGTGVLKGPVRPTRGRQQWRVDERSGLRVLEWVFDDTFEVKYVDPWLWFPHPDARVVADSPDFFELHLMNRRDLRQLAKNPSVFKDQVRELLQSGSSGERPWWINELRAITNLDIGSSEDLFEVWEYIGPIDTESFQEIAGTVDQGLQDTLAADYQGADVLDELMVSIIFCQGYILKMTEYHMESGCPIYHVFNWQKDRSSIWGYGVPRILRDQHQSSAAAYRMMMDNAGLSTGPQIMIDRNYITPMNGSYKLTARKVWGITKPIPRGAKVMDTFNIDSHLPDLMALIDKALELADVETGISQLAQGEQGADVTKTAKGMALLMNSSNIIFKRIVKQWDDDLTVPLIKACYEFKMLYSKNKAIYYGDAQVHARGSSVLMVRELMSSNLIQILDRAVGNPILFGMTKIEKLYRQVVRSMQIPDSEIVLSDDEIQQKAAEEAAKPQQPDIEQLKLQLTKEIALIRSKTEVHLAEINADAAMAKTAETLDADEEKWRAQLADRAQDRAMDYRKFMTEMQFDERSLAAEIGMKRETGTSAGGRV